MADEDPDEAIRPVTPIGPRTCSPSCPQRDQLAERVRQSDGLDLACIRRSLPLTG
jgi:hypothetical protein